MTRAGLALSALFLTGCAAAGSGDDGEMFRTIAFEGNEHITRERLLEAADDHLRDYMLEGVGKAAIDDAAYRIELFYKDKGYAFAEVDYAIRYASLGVDDEVRDVRFSIQEGPRVRLEELALDGGEAFSEAEMRAFTQAEVGTPGDSFYVRRAMSSAADRVLSEALARGYFDADVTVEEVELDSVEGIARAAIVLQPGLLHVLDAVELTGDEVPDVLRKEVDRSLGIPYQPRGIAALITRIAELLRDRGYPDARIDIAERSSEEGRVKLVLAVTTGEQVRISAVRFDGQMDTRSSYLRDLVGLKPGARYSASDVRAAAQRVYESGLFATVRQRLEPPEGPERDLVFELEELPSLELWVEPGWGSYDGPRARAGVRESNLLGTGWILRSEGVLSAKTRRAEIGVTDPVFFMRDLSLDVAVQYTRREEPSFEFEEGAVETVLARRWSDALTTTIGYRFKRSNLLAEDLDLIDPGDVLAEFDVSAVEFKAINDTRDNLLFPASGARIEFSAAWADESLGSELDFLRSTLNTALFTRLRKGLILGVRAAGGAIIPTQTGQAIPLQERFFLGGESTVRSFRESELGPKDASGEPIGGEAYTLFTVELRQALPRNFEVSAFGDAGNVQSEYEEIFSGKDLSYALGLGLRYELPVGALRLDFGWNPDPVGEEDDYALHFSLGQAF